MTLRIKSPLAPVLLALVITVTGCVPVFVPNRPEESPLPTQSAPAIPASPGWTPQTAGDAADLPSIADVVAQVNPSVVAINVQARGQDFFGNPFTQEGAGSGWIIDSDGLVVTNNHVIEGATRVSVSLADGRTFTAEERNVYSDPTSDLAVIKIDATGLPAIALGDSDKLHLGDWVIALGNALGRGVRVTNGIVSELGVTVDIETGVTLEDLIGTNAAINPGNSGGPLVNMAGQVIGITSVKISAAGVEGIGFAISINTAKPIIQQLINKGFVMRAYLGVSAATVSPFTSFQRNLGVDRGAFVIDVGDGSPAAQAGLKSGDVITRFNGRDITSSNDLISAIHAAQIGQTVEVTYWRDQAENKMAVTLAESPEPAR